MDELIDRLKVLAERQQELIEGMLDSFKAYSEELDSMIQELKQ